jgi:hypothetical protein
LPTNLIVQSDSIQNFLFLLKQKKNVLGTYFMAYFLALFLNKICYLMDKKELVLDECRKPQRYINIESTFMPVAQSDKCPH